MARSPLFQPHDPAPFGNLAPSGRPLDQAELATALMRRLAEKYGNYERAAARLELRGETDAAAVLRRAAKRLQLLKKPPPAEPETF